MISASRPRFTLYALSLLFLWNGLPLAGGGSIEQREDGTTVIHLVVHSWALPNPVDIGTAKQADMAMVYEFQRRFPEIFAERYREEYESDPDRFGDYSWENVEVELHRAQGIEVPGVESDLLAIAGEMAPDIIYVNFRKSDNYIRNGFLYPLDNPEDDYFTAMSEEEVDFRVHPKLWPVIRRKGPGGEKRLWMMPYGGTLGKVLLYRKDLFDEKGLDYPTADWTWDDLYEAARRLTDPERGIYGFRLDRGISESWFWVTFLWSAGGEVMVYDEETDEWTCTFGSREAAVALEFYNRLNTEKWYGEDGKIHRGYSYRESSDATVQWNNGKIAMTFGYVDEKLLSTINPEVTGMAPVPLGPTGKRGAELNSRMLGLFSGIEEPAIRDAAWEYIRFCDSKPAMRIKTRILVEGGLGRFVNPKYLRLYGYPEVERLAPPGWAETFRIAIETGKPEPYGKNSNFAYKLMSIPLQKAAQMSLADELPEDYEQRVDVFHRMLIDANARANEQMIGIIKPEERRTRNLAASGVLALIAVTFFLVFRKVFRIFTPSDTAGLVRKGKWQFRRYRWAYLLMLPAVLTIFMWRYVPLARGSIMAFQDYRLVGESAWVGLDNFGDLLWDNFWWQSVWNALRYSFLIMALTFLPPIILAIMLQEIPRGRLLFRTIFYLPAVITGLVTVILWKQFYGPTEYGVLNSILMHIPAVVFLGIGGILLGIALVFARRMVLHEMKIAAVIFALGGVLLLLQFTFLARPILFPPQEPFFQSLLHIPGRLFHVTPEPFRWLDDPRTAMLACVVPMVWAGMGPGCLIYLAALKGIPDDYYEAADVDGASVVDKILFVVFPILKPLILINFIGVFIRSWYGATGRILAMTGGSADTEVAGLHIFYKAFLYLKFGPATAAAWVLAFMLIGFTVHQLRILSRLEFRTTGGEDK